MTEEEKLKISRSTAMQMAATSGTVIWSSFNSILFANTALVTISGLVGTSTALRPQLPSWTTSSLAIVGILVCAAWYCTLKRHFAYMRYYLECTKFFDGKLLSKGGLNVLELGNTYGDGGKVHIDKLPLQMPWTGRAFKIEWLMTLIIGVFAALYGFIFWFSIH